MVAGDAQSAWQLSGSAPELYQRHLVPAITARWAADLVERAGLSSGDRVLDVACGTGVVAFEAAERVGPTGTVAAVDVNAGMLAVARSLPLPPGAGITWHECSALDLPFPPGSFDAALCQFGLQFVPDRPRALREMSRVLALGGRLGLSVFSPIERNPATHALSDALDRHVAPDASRTKRTEHALDDPRRLEALVADAGFGDVRVETVTKTIHFPSAADYVHIQLGATPLASVLAGLDTADRDAAVSALVADVSAALKWYHDETGISFPQEVHVLLAVR
jgi:ubiquinone/menaquinone biosynthesis C-methylase UbiE